MLFVLAVVLACKSGKDDTPTATSATPVTSAAATAPPASTSAAASASETTPTPGKKKKLPGKTGSKSLGKGSRGGTGPSRPSSATILKTSTRTMGLGDDVTPKPNPDPCDSLPDRVAECDGKRIYYCQEHDMETLDCNKMAQSAGYTSGDCFESTSGGIADCLGCDVDDDGKVLCCDFGGLICCDNDGNCYDPPD